MDYKELIMLLRDPALRDMATRTYYMYDAADAIETLLAERGATLEDLRKRPHPSTCKHGEHCDYISAITGFPDCYSCDEWEWRGPQKEGGKSA